MPTTMRDHAKRFWVLCWLVGVTTSAGCKAGPPDKATTCNELRQLMTEDMELEKRLADAVGTLETLEAHAARVRDIGERVARLEIGDAPLKKAVETYRNALAEVASGWARTAAVKDKMYAADPSGERARSEMVSARIQGSVFGSVVANVRVTITNLCWP